MNLPNLGELELEVLRAIWREQPCTERQVSDLIAGNRKVARTTILKTIQRLEAKGVLVRVPGEGAIRFRAAVDERKFLPVLVKRFVDRMLGGSLEPLIAYFGGSAPLTEKDVEALRKIAKKIVKRGDDE